MIFKITYNNYYDPKNTHINVNIIIIIIETYAYWLHIHLREGATEVGAYIQTLSVLGCYRHMSGLRFPSRLIAAADMA